MDIIELIQDKYKVISVVGMAKNSGKTMTLNSIIDQSIDRQIKLGLTSTGRDGEREDLVTTTQKPLIYVDKGTILATSEQTLELCKVKLEILEVTNINTSMGKVVIARVINSGYVQIAGPSINEHMKEICDKLLSCGVDLVVVDGAIDRLASASPSITEATILATGAVLNRNMNKVIEKTLHQIKIFSLEKEDDDTICAMAKSAIKQKKYLILDDSHNVYDLNIKTALNSGNIIGSNLNEDSRYVIIGGSLVTKTLKDIILSTKLYKNVTFIVLDATKIFIDSKDYMYFNKMGVKIKVLNPIKPLGVTINPYAPEGYYFDSREFLEKMKKFLYPTPVFDVVLGGE